MNSSTTPNLWGELPELIPLSAPATILQQQARLLTDMTKGTLTAFVTSEAAVEIGHVLMIRAPVLGNYRARVLSIEHGPMLYPVEINSISSATPIKCQNEENFLGELSKVFNSKEVRKLIQGLLSASSASNSLPPPPRK